MIKKKNNSFLYLIGSVALIIVAIAATSIINRSKNATTESTDIRTKAGSLSTLKFSGTVVSTDDGKGIFVLDNLRFSDNSQDNSLRQLGSWTVTPPSGFNLASLFSGSKVTITVDSSTFLINSHTVTATQILVNR